jgi:hypothetical protein
LIGMKSKAMSFSNSEKTAKLSQKSECWEVGLGSGTVHNHIVQRWTCIVVEI